MVQTGVTHWGTHTHTHTHLTQHVCPQKKQCLAPCDPLAVRWALLCVCLRSRYTGNTPCTACHLTNQRTACTQGRGSVKAGEADRRSRSAEDSLRLNFQSFAAFFDRWSTDRHVLLSVFIPFFLLFIKVWIQSSVLLSFSVFQFRSHHRTFRLSVTEVQVA